MAEDTSALFATEVIEGVTVVRPTGWRVPPELGEALYALLDSLDDPRLILDLKNVRFLSSHGIAILVSLDKRAKAAGGCLRICRVEPDVLELFRVTKMDGYLSIDADEAAALAALRNTGS